MRARLGQSGVCGWRDCNTAASGGRSTHGRITGTKIRHRHRCTRYRHAPALARPNRQPTPHAKLALVFHALMVSTLRLTPPSMICTVPQHHSTVRTSHIATQDTDVQATVCCSDANSPRGSATCLFSRRPPSSSRPGLPSCPQRARDLPAATHVLRAHFLAGVEVARVLKGAPLRNAVLGAVAGLKAPAVRIQAVEAARAMQAPRHGSWHVRPARYRRPTKQDASSRSTP